jgi:TadE-like protein
VGLLADPAAAEPGPTGQPVPAGQPIHGGQAVYAGPVLAQPGVAQPAGAVQPGQPAVPAQPPGKPGKPGKRSKQPKPSKVAQAAAKPAKDKGAALSEFAGILPLIGLVLLLVWQAVLVGLTSMYASHAANEAARAAAVLGNTPGAQQEIRKRAVARIAGPWGDEEHLTLDVRGDTATVTIDTPIVLPGFQSSWAVSADAAIVREGDGGGIGVNLP